MSIRPENRLNLQILQHNLNDSVRELDERIHQVRLRRQHEGERTSSWLESWNLRRRQIADKLGRIERRLQRVTAARPKLSVVGFSSDGR